MHSYFYRRLSQRPCSDALQNDSAVQTPRAVGMGSAVAAVTAVTSVAAGAAPFCDRLSANAREAARRAVAVRMALGQRLTEAQARTLDIMEAGGGLRTTCRLPGEVPAFRLRKGR